MKKFFSLLCLTAVLSMLLCACRLIRIEEEKPAPLEYTVINQENIPKEAEKLIEEKKEKEFQLTYQRGENLYLVKGYGRQMSGGYSIAVDTLGETENAVIFQTTLIGPPDLSRNTEISYPYIVVKIRYTEKPVMFD